MDRAALKALADTRLADAAVLIDAERWAASYYLAGYAVECGLKAVLLRHLGESAAVFGDESYRKELMKCWTHDLAQLVSLAGLTADLGQACGGDARLEEFWNRATRWNEATRYSSAGRDQATGLYEAITDPDHGVLQWIRSRW